MAAESGLHLLFFVQEDTVLAAKAASRDFGQLLVRRIGNNTRSLELWNSLCQPRGQPDEPLLLLPEQYELLDPDSANETLVELLQVHFME